MRKLGVLLMCVLIAGVTTAAFAEVKNVETSGTVRTRYTWADISDDVPDIDVGELTVWLGVEATFTEDVTAFIELLMSAGMGGDASREAAAGGLLSPWECDGYDDYYDYYDDYWDYKSAGASSPLVTGIDTDETISVYQAYIQADEMFDYPVSAKLGRQAMPKGTELLMGEDRFYQGLSFDAVQLTYAENDIAVDVWFAKLVERFNTESDCDDDLYGVYGTYTGLEDMVIDAYVLYLRQARRGGMAETDNQYTLGARAAGTDPWVGLSYNAEVAAQLGEDGGDNDYEGWLIDLLLSYAIEAEYNPNVFFGYTFTTGDDDPNDNDNETFTFPFTDRHARWGYADLFGLGNLNVFKLGASADATDKLKVIAQILWFLVHEDKGMLNVAGTPVASNSNDDSVAQELDISLAYAYSDDLQFELTYGHVFADDWMEDSLSDDDVDMVYAQALVTF